MDALDAFLEDLSSAEPVPGGGSVAALETSLGAALLMMVANLTLGRKKYEAVQQQAADIRDHARRLRDRACELVQEDINAYRRVADAMSLPRITDDDKAVRRTRLQEALKGAARPPLETMKVAAEVAQLARDLVLVGNQSAISDVGTAVLSASSGYTAARLNVEINLIAVRDESWLAETRREMQSIPDVDLAKTEVMSRVERAISGAGE
jgi:formiminotetrahydrofolate cyclodeaminase